MKFEVKYPTDKDFCTQCEEQISECYLKLEQNRWTKLNLCVNCLRELLKQIETGKLPERNKKVIVYKPSTLNKNSWMGNKW